MKKTRWSLVALGGLLMAAPLLAQQPAASESAASARADRPPAKMIKVPAGTRLAMVLQNAINSRNAHRGDPVYLQTVFPVTQNNRVLIPAGSYVQGELLEAKRPGRIRGRGEVRIRLTTLILPNGYTVKFGAVPSNVGTGGGETTGKEGDIKGDTNKAGDAGTIVKTGGVGAGIGAIAGRSASGAGIGAAAGAAVGLATVLLTRGPELELPRGTTLDATLDRPLYLDASEIHFTAAGQATALPGPPNREPVRNRNPF